MSSFPVGYPYGVNASGNGSFNSIKFGNNVNPIIDCTSGGYLYLKSPNGYYFSSDGNNTRANGIINCGDIFCGNITLSIDNASIKSTSTTNSFYLQSYNGYFYFGTSGSIANANITAGTFNATSDYRVKENVDLLQESFLDNLRPVTYTLKDSNKPSIGFIAHELQEWYPELVEGEKDGEKMQSINYSGLIPVLVKEVQDLRKENKNLCQTIQQLVERIEALEERCVKLF